MLAKLTHALPGRRSATSSRWSLFHVPTEAIVEGGGGGGVGGGEYLVCSELPFLAEAGRQVLGLGLLLGQVVLVVKMLVLNLTDRDPYALGLAGREE